MNWEWWVQQWNAGVNPGTSNPQVNCMYGEAIGKNESPWSGQGRMETHSSSVAMLGHSHTGPLTVVGNGSV